MASQVEIVNRALAKLGSDPIISIDDNVKSARTMSSLWDTVRKAELRRRFWNFALTRTSLPALADAPAWGFANAFQLPSDWLRMVQINDLYISPSMVDYRDSDDSPYAIEGQQILTDFGAPLKIRYVRDILDPGSFDALFVEALASKLALEGCERITQSSTKKADLRDDYKMAITEAVRANAVEKPPQGMPDDSWMLVRL